MLDSKYKIWAISQKRYKNKLFCAMKMCNIICSKSIFPFDLWDYNYISPFLFNFPITSMYPSLLFFKLVICYLLLCHAYMHVHICSWIYYMLSIISSIMFLSDTHMHMFRADHLVWNKPLVCPWGRAFLLFLAFFSCLKLFV